MKKYPIQRKPDGRRYPIQSYRQPNLNVPASIIPRFSKGHNIAGQISTKIHLKNARGEEMTIYQNQQVLNLLPNHKGSFVITHGNNRNFKGGRRKWAMMN